MLREEADYPERENEANEVSKSETIHAELKSITGPLRQIDSHVVNSLYNYTYVIYTQCRPYKSTMYIFTHRATVFLRTFDQSMVTASFTLLNLFSS